MFPAFKDKHCVFGHTPTMCLHDSEDSHIWVDPVHKDKTCIDGGCVFGGVLTAFRLDDGEAFYVSKEESLGMATATVA